MSESIKIPSSGYFTPGILAAMDGKDVLYLYRNIKSYFRPGTEEYKRSLANISECVLKKHPDLATVGEIDAIRKANAKANSRKPAKKRAVRKESAAASVPARKARPPAKRPQKNRAARGPPGKDDYVVSIDGKLFGVPVNRRNVAAMQYFCAEGIAFDSRSVERSDGIDRQLERMEKARYFDGFRTFISSSSDSAFKSGYYFATYIYLVMRALGIGIKDLRGLSIKKSKGNDVLDAIVLKLVDGSVVEMMPVCDDEKFHGEFAARKGNLRCVAKIFKKS